MCLALPTPQMCDGDCSLRWDTLLTCWELCFMLGAEGVMLVALALMHATLPLIRERSSETPVRTRHRSFSLGSGGGKLRARARKSLTRLRSLSTSSPDESRDDPTEPMSPMSPMTPTLSRSSSDSSARSSTPTQFNDDDEVRRCARCLGAGWRR